jgi:putative toxin-antitoxin system antitoxin component (TIGR02293 family)
MKPPTKTKSAKFVKKRAPVRPVPAKKPKPSADKKLKVAPGLDFGEFEALRRQLDLSLEELTVRLGFSRATIAKRKATGRLTPDESGKVVCYALLLGHAVHLFGGLEEARQWLKTPQRRLHGAVPLDHAQSDVGARDVENLLTELAFGIKS